MARRRKKQTFEDMLIEMVVKSMMAIVVFLVFNYVIIGKYAGSMIGGVWLSPLLIVLVFVMAAGLGIYLANIKMKMERANIHEIDKMSGSTFERYLERFFKKRGWQVKRTGGQGDYGADLILTSASKKVVVQAKRWQKNVGYEAIQQVYTSKDVYKCNEAWVITNSGFTEQAIDGAKRLGVVLWDREKLIDEMAKVNAASTLISESAPAADNIVVKNTGSTAQGDLYVCASCGKPVTQKVKEFCLSQPKRFNSRIYCYEHQRQQ
ncbi:restriction endonuclease [Paenibacillus puerhi]|uniref:restriction endonuclease n=1 Tax=Paenibacillus puerhi TaxID=2692622 RepID=UPI00135CC408|nr:restriction endonuclease [Paenibacillus puerhi]